MHQGRSVEDIHQLTNIDKWFLNKLMHIVKMEQILTYVAHTSQLSRKS